jgi:alanine or glycine:cation symporter, AGCS family
VRKEHGAAGDISHFAALMTAMAATVGTGNIVGVATAIGLGGPGALFWMWVTGLVGMATKYSEALLSVKYRVTNERGEQAGGPMYYLSEGIRWKPLGRTLGWVFALFTACARLRHRKHGAVELRGRRHRRRVRRAWLDHRRGHRARGRRRDARRHPLDRGFTSLFVPAMIVIYMGACAIVLVFNFSAIPAAFALVITDAFTGTSAAGGFLGATIAQAMRYGVARGIFSNESGLGSAGIAAAAAKTQEPVRQAMVSMTQTFLDTLVICTFTGIAIIASGTWDSGINGVALTQLAFGTALPGPIGPAVVAICLAMFAFSTILGWSHYGSRGIEYILGVRAILPYRLLFVVAAFLGSIYTLDFVWLLSDVMNGLMALPNLVGLLLLSGVVTAETRSYFERQRLRSP